VRARVDGCLTLRLPLVDRWLHLPLPPFVRVGVATRRPRRGGGALRRIWCVTTSPGDDAAARVPSAVPRACVLWASFRACRCRPDRQQRSAARRAPLADLLTTTLAATRGRTSPPIVVAARRPSTGCRHRPVAAAAAEAVGPRGGPGRDPARRPVDEAVRGARSDTTPLSARLAQSPLCLHSGDGNFHAMLRNFTRYEISHDVPGLVADE